MKLYLVRHGETESNLRRIYAGWNKEELTIKGRNKIVDVAKRLPSIGIDQIYTSPIKRATQTAEIIGYFLKKRPIVDQNFEELRLGIWQGMHEEEVARQFPEEWRIWNTRPAELILEGRETLHELLERVLSGIREIRLREKDSTVLIVTHLAIIRVLLLLYTKKMDLNLYRTIPVLNGEIFQIKDELLE